MNFEMVLNHELLVDIPIDLLMLNNEIDIKQTQSLKIAINYSGSYSFALSQTKFKLYIVSF